MIHLLVVTISIIAQKLYPYILHIYINDELTLRQTRQLLSVPQFCRLHDRTDRSNDRPYEDYVRVYEEQKKIASYTSFEI